MYNIINRNIKSEEKKYSYNPTEEGKVFGGITFCSQYVYIKRHRKPFYQDFAFE